LIVLFISAVANARNHKNTRKIECLESFAEGVRASGGSVVVEWETPIYTQSFGSDVRLGNYKHRWPQYLIAKQIIAEQRRTGNHTMCIDASCWKYVDINSNYLRYSIGGPFYDRAEYANQNSDDSKWIEISRTSWCKIKIYKNKKRWTYFNLYATRWWLCNENIESHVLAQ
jgi:hypothetical protein